MLRFATLGTYIATYNNALPSQNEQDTFTSYFAYLSKHWDLWGSSSVSMLTAEAHKFENRYRKTSFGHKHRATDDV